MINIISFNISTDKNDKDSIYFPDLIGAQLGIKEAKDNIRQFLDRQETKTKTITDNIPKMIKTINEFFGDKK
jgi:uncharacterized protein (DUF2225 family)